MSIKIENLVYKYMPDTPFEKTAVDEVSLEIKDGEFIGIIGHTGSGKSTLIQEINGLLKPTSGNIYIDGECVTKKGADLKKIRQKVGLVFQYPEYQLFEETVYKDVAFGPANLGLSDAEIDNRVKRALKNVGLDFEKYKNRSPFELSGGQRRRVAIAGIIAMEPKVLILDEPTAGLDPRGRDEILNGINLLHKEYKLTIIMVSHSMEDMAKLANRLVVMNKGKILLTGTPREVFRNIETLEKVGLAAPQVTYLARRLNEKGFKINENIITVEEAREEIIKVLGRKTK
jgi:energy-coupling factor transport system ATP-binding protein